MSRPQTAERLTEALEQALGDLSKGISDDPGRFAELPGHTMTAEEVGELKCIRRSAKRVRELAGDGAFPGAYQQGNSWMFPPESVRIYLRNLQQETAESHDFAPRSDGKCREKPSAVIKHVVTRAHAGRGRADEETPASSRVTHCPGDETDWNAYEEEFDG